ncbi:MAG: hypothetical protein WDZ52_08875 [Pseudohongiellaceae bacterium]
MTILVDRKPANHLVLTQSLATLLVTLSILIQSNATFAQELSTNLAGRLAPALDTVLDTAPRSLLTAESEFSAYDRQQIEQLADLGRLNQSAGEFQQASSQFRQALHVARINNGLYHESQITIVDDIIDAEISLRNWDEVNNFYAYQEHLYQRLYKMDDPRLEAGLKKISAWHINALNVNLDGKRVDHLRQANKLFKLRMQIAENTLSMDDPQVAVLARNIKICERELFLASDLNREMMVRQEKANQSRRQAYLDNERRLIVNLD